MWGPQVARGFVCSLNWVRRSHSSPTPTDFAVPTMRLMRASGKRNGNEIGQSTRNDPQDRRPHIRHRGCHIAAFRHFCSCAQYHQSVQIVFPNAVVIHRYPCFIPRKHFLPELGCLPALRAAVQPSVIVDKPFQDHDRNEMMVFRLIHGFCNSTACGMSAARCDRSPCHSAGEQGMVISQDWRFPSARSEIDKAASPVAGS